uniref:Uncharacterized protein n=1 Tax=Sus scrofa TaxID=9823 RepID=A0A8W4FEB7_PIG
MEALCSALHTLAIDSKYRAKADRQCQCFTFCAEEIVCFELEVLYVDSWAQCWIYTTFKDVLGSGMHHHLQSNKLLHDIFGLGAVLVLDATVLKACKISWLEAPVQCCFLQGQDQVLEAICKTSWQTSCEAGLPKEEIVHILACTFNKK